MNPKLTSGITGAAPIWNKIMASLVKNKPNLAFLRPAEIAEGVVDGHRDLIVPGISNIGLAINLSSPKASAGSITYTDPLSTFEADQTGQVQIIH